MVAEATSRAPKEEGSIANAFPSLEGQAPVVLPERFSALKKEIFQENLIQNWKEVLTELESATEEIMARGSDVSSVRNHIFSLFNPCSQYTPPDYSPSTVFGYTWRALYCTT